MKLKQIVEETGTLPGRVFDLTTQLLIVISLLGFCFETLPDLGQRTKQTLYGIEVVVVAVFTIEYLLRIAVADKKLGFIFSLGGVVDLLAILPFYLPTTMDLRSIRVFRLFRIVRVFKLLRYGQAIQRFRKAFASIQEELILYTFATAFVVFLSSVGIYYFEHDTQPEQFKSVFHCLWWSVTTLTTVGYGDTYPVTAGGRFFTSIVLFVGLGIVAVPTGLMASALTSIKKTAEQ